MLKRNEANLREGEKVVIQFMGCKVFEHFIIKASN